MRTDVSMQLVGQGGAIHLRDQPTPTHQWLLTLGSFDSSPHSVRLKDEHLVQLRDMLSAAIVAHGLDKS